jgi:hypothetical protein
MARDRESGGTYSNDPAELSKICLPLLPTFQMRFATTGRPHNHAAALRR